MSRKIVPPVTPRIVRDNPRQRLFRIGLLLFAFLLSAWFGYDYGRSEHPLPVRVDGEVILPGNSTQRIALLEQERDRLKQQVAELQQGMEQANQALGASQARIQALQETLSSTGSPQEVVATPLATPRAAAVEAASDAPASVDDLLVLERLEIEPTASEDSYRLHFSVRRTADSDERVTGNIWIAVNGMVNRKPKRLSLKVLSPQQHAYVKMGFERQQDVVEELVLPAEFVPGNILIEAKPYGDRFTPVSEKFSWEEVSR